MNALLAVIVALACWRLARLLTIDEIFRPIRENVVGRNPDGQIAYLVTCPWCLSIWSSPILIGLAVWFPTNRLVWLLLGTLAASGLAGLLVTVEDRMDR